MQHAAVFLGNEHPAAWEYAAKARAAVLARVFWRQPQTSCAAWAADFATRAQRTGVPLILRIWAWRASTPDDPHGLAGGATTVTLDAWTRGLRETAQACRGRVLAYQLENEVDISGGPAAYVERFKAGAAVIRAADPGALVVMAGIARHHSAWLDSTRAAWPHADAVAVHEYGMEPGNAVEVARTWLRLNGQPNMPVWCTEYGASGDGYAQAVAIRQRALSIRNARPDVAALYRMADEAAGPGFGIIAATGRPKPAWEKWHQTVAL